MKKLQEMSDFEKIYSETPMLYNSVADMWKMTQTLVIIIKLTQQISCPLVVLDDMGDTVLSPSQFTKICLSNPTSQYQLRTWEIQAIWNKLFNALQSSYLKHYKALFLLKCIWHWWYAWQSAFLKLCFSYNVEKLMVIGIMRKCYQLPAFIPGNISLICLPPEPSFCNWPATLSPAWEAQRYIFDADDWGL